MRQWSWNKIHWYHNLFVFFLFYRRLQAFEQKLCPTRTSGNPAVTVGRCQRRYSPKGGYGGLPRVYPLPVRARSLARSRYVWRYRQSITNICRDDRLVNECYSAAPKSNWKTEGKEREERREKERGKTEREKEGRETEPPHRLSTPAAII